ncbi:MAG TPA: hypothetical protein ENJ31_04065 [Anaerolineae bacterium]|nr:hypothetical protein [Anaerolineae bacterium]
MSILQQLYRLQLVDSEWDEKSRRLEEVQASLGETDDLRRARQAVAEMEAELEALRRKTRAVELDVAAVAARLQKNQDRLYSGKVRNPKELANLNEEAAALRRRQSELEDRQLELMIEGEEAEAELAERQARLRQIEATWRAEQAALQQEQANLKARLAELAAEREAMRAQIGAAELAEYDDLRARYGGKAVTALRRGICQTCGVDVPTGVARAVEREEGFYYCPVCHRLLYGG